MENIFLSADWHLYSTEHTSNHPYRSRLDLLLLKDNIGEGMTEVDLWINLGDLCDPKEANRDMLRRILSNIPARKILVRGNHDTEDDQWYLDLGFDQVTDRVIIHNMLFTHKPEPVPPDWINIHGHIHFEKIAMDRNHINAYATNWNDACHPVLLDDLLHGAKVQKIDTTRYKEEKYQKYFTRSMADGQELATLDLTDEFKLYPMDESAGSVQTMHEILEFNRELGNWDYGVWNGTRLIKNPKDADYDSYVTMKRDQFARAKGGTCWDYVPYEISEFAKRWPKVQRHGWNIYFEDGKSSPSHAFMTFQVGRGGWMLFEASDKMHRGIWCGGSENDIVSQCFLWLAEANGVDIKKTKAWATRYAPLESKWFSIKPQTYMDQLTKTVNEWKIDPTVELIPYGESVNEGSSLIESILFPDVDTTKYFEADDNEYKKKAEKAEVEQKGDSAVAMDEAIIKFHKGASDTARQDVDEQVSDLNETLQARVPRTLYHGSNTLVTGELIPMDSGTTGVHLFATDSYAFALAFAGKQWNDLEINQTSIGGTMYLTEILPGKLQEKYGDGGFVYELPGNAFSRFRDTRHEFITDVPVKPIKVHRMFNLIDEMRKAGVKIYEYPNLPHFIKSRKDYIMGKCKVHDIRIPKDVLAQLKAENARNRTVRLAEAAIPILNDILAESAGAKSVIDPNHKQKGTMKLSDLKLVKVDKEYLQKHGKKGALRDASASNEYCATVAWELDGEPIVTIAVGYPNPKEREPGDNYNWIGNLLVDPKYRGYGLGRQAMNYAIEKLGGDALAVRSNNEIAISMYKKRGFKTSKDSARAVANKHANYYQMYLHEDLGTSIGELDESIVDGTSYFKKMTGPGGPYIKVHEDLKPGNVAGQLSIKASDIIDEIIHIDPSIIDIDEFSGVKDATELVDYVKSVMKKVSDGVPEDEIYDTSSRGYVAGISLLMQLARRFPGKGLGAINNKTIDGLIPNFDSIEEFNAWKIRRINEWYDVINLLIKAYNINAQIIGESIVPSVLSNRSKGLEALTKAGYVDPLERGGVAIYDFKNFGGGKVYLNTNSFSTKEINASNLLVRALEYDNIVIAHGGYDAGEWTIDPMKVNGKLCYLANDVIDAIRSKDKHATIDILCCNPGGVVPKTSNGVSYGMTSLILENAAKLKPRPGGNPVKVLDACMTDLGKDYQKCVKLINRVNFVVVPKSISYIKVTKHGNLKLIDEKLDADIAAGVFIGILKDTRDAIMLAIERAKSMLKIIDRRISNLGESSGYFWVLTDSTKPTNKYTANGEFINDPELRFDTMDECYADAAEYLMSTGYDVTTCIGIAESVPNTIPETVGIVGAASVINHTMSNIVNEAISDYVMDEASTQWLSKPNLELNLNKFESGKDNLLLITGISGGGKSMLAEKLAEQYGAEIINLDIVQRFYINGPDTVANWSEERFKRGKVKVHPFDLEYYRENPNIPWGKIPKEEGWCKPDYLYWLIDRCRREPNRRFIIDGAVITYADPEALRGIPLIIVGTGALKAHWRRSVRLTKNRGSFVEWIKAVAKGVDKMTHINNMKLAAQSTSDFRARMEGETVNEAIASTESLNRLTKEEIADRYELRDVGNTHAAEDKLYADIAEYKRASAAKRKQYQKEHEKELRLKYLKKANRARKRKRILRKIKRAILPGVKNEAVDTVDDSQTENREIGEIREDETFGGGRRRYFDSKAQYANASEADDGPVIIESSVRVVFNESATTTPIGSDDKPLYVAFFSMDGIVRDIALVNPELKDRFLRVMRNGKGDAKRITLKPMSDVQKMDPDKASYDLFIVFGSEGEDLVEEVCRRYDAYANAHATLTLANAVDDMPNIEVCKRLAQNLSGRGDDKTELDVRLVHHSNRLEANRNELVRKADLIVAEKNLALKIQEGAEIDLHPDNPWQDLILEYQLGFGDM